MTTDSFVPKRLTRRYTQTIDAAPERVFPLLCPVREAEWLDGWRYRMLHSESGLAEEGAVFTTPRSGEPDTVWIITRHEPASRLVEFTRFTPGSRVCVLRVGVRPADPAGSSVDITYMYTSTSPAGNRFIDAFTERRFSMP